MFRADRSEILRALALLGACLIGPTTSADEPKADGPPPIAIILETPADFEAMLRRLARPDFVIESGARFDRRQLVGPPAREPLAVVESVEIRGEVIEDLAHLTIEIGATVPSPGPTRLSVGLDGLTLVESTEGGRSLPTFFVEGAWQVEPGGPGRHAIRVRALGRVNQVAEGPRLEFGIPQAASTALELTVNGPVAAATLGAKEPLAIAPVEGGRSSRLSAHLTPRRRLELSWRLQPDARAQGEPQLTAKGEIELTVEPGSSQARAVWSVDCEQGTARSLRFRLDPAEDLLGLEVDNRPIPIEGVRDPASGLATIPLAEPLRPGGSARVQFLTRRPHAAGGSASMTYRGTPLLGAIAQFGVLAIARAGELGIVATADRGLRQLDPGRDLPQGLRSRPSTVLAYQFFAQPIDLTIRIEPSTRRVRVDARSRISLGPAESRVETRLDCRIISGAVFQLQVEVPEGLDWEKAGPDDLLSSAQILPEAPADPSTPSRLLVLTLSAKARESRSFALVLAGRPSSKFSKTAAIGLFRPRQGGPRGSEILIQTSTGIEAEPLEGSGFAPIPAAPPDWPPELAADPARPRLWLRGEGSPAAVPLRLVEVPKVVRSESTSIARFRRRAVEVRQETICRVLDGTLSTLDIEVPGALADAWEVDEPAVSGRRRLPDAPGGSARFRLKLAREVADSVALAFRFRLPIDPGEGRSAPDRLEVPVLRVLDGKNADPRYELSADVGVAIRPIGPGWVEPRGADPDDPAGGRASARWSRPATTPGPAAVSVGLEPLASLPSIVASRLWLRTTLGPSGGLRTSAWYRLEPDASSFGFKLPAGSTLGRIRVDGEPPRGVESIGEGGYRVAIPASDRRPVHVLVEFETPPARSSEPWPAPILTDGGLVRRTLWTARLPWSHAAIGVPGGWTDENRWAWNTYAWMRRPTRADADLSAWIQGAVPGGTPPWIEPDASHEYLFGRPGGPSPLPIRVASRASLVGVCSGASLLLGLGLVSWRVSSRRLLIGGSVAVLGAVVLIDPSVLLLGLEASAIGLVLALLAALAQGLVDRPRKALSVAFGEPSNPANGAGSGPGPSQFVGIPDVGSDESTIVRRPIGSTADHVPAWRDPADGKPEDEADDLRPIEPTHAPRL